MDGWMDGDGQMSGVVSATPAVSVWLASYL